jgi:Alpha amylase, catalytic domain/Maltogenic Amylase, C-terminal domain
MSSGINRRTFLEVVGGAAAVSQVSTPSSPAGPAHAPAPSRSRAASSWIDSLSCSTPIFLRPRKGNKDAVFPVKPAAAAARRLDEFRDAGIGMVEVYAPAEAGNSFLGLDTINRYRVDPRIGTMDDFRRLVDLAHAKGLKIISIDNLGYCSVEAVDFLKACDDVKAGRDSREARMFLWADSPDAPPPPGAGRPDPYFMVRPTHLGGYESPKHEFWQPSARAGKHYWTRWPGEDLAGNRVRLPQYNWFSAEFQEESERIVRFWMDTGIDGMMIDAVNWYVGCDWAKTRRRMTDVINGDGVKYSQPEGAGAFRDDPVAWVTDGGWACVQDYGLGIFWEKGSNVVTKAIESGDPRSIEPALRNYHDRVVEAGGVLFFSPLRFEDATRSRLAVAVTAAVGDLVSWSSVIDDLWSPVIPDTEEAKLMKLKATHPALFNRGRRQVLPVAAPERHYAFLRAARAGGERVIVVLNFQGEAQMAELNLSGVDFATATDLLSGGVTTREPLWRVELPPFGYRFFELDARKDGRG